MEFCTRDQQYTLRYSFDPYVLLFTSDFSCVVYPMSPVPCRVRLAMVHVRALLDSVKVLLQAINWATIYFYEKYASASLSSTEAKFSFSSAA